MVGWISKTPISTLDSYYIAFCHMFRNGYTIRSVWFSPLGLNAMHLLHCIGAPWWRHQMETFSALLALCAGNSPVPGEFPSQRPVTRSFDVFFDLRLNKHLSKQSRGWSFETPSCSLWCHRNDTAIWGNSHRSFLMPGDYLTSQDQKLPI